MNQLTWSQAVSSRDDGDPLENGETLLLWQRRGFCGVQRAVLGEVAHAQHGEVPEDKLTVPAYEEDETKGEKTARIKAEDERKKQPFIVPCELVQCLDNASINFVRLHKPNGVEAWKAIVGKHRTTERPGIETLLTQLAGLKMEPREKVTDYLTRAEGIRLDLQEAGDMTPTFENIATVLIFGQRNGYEAMKQDLIKFANTRAEPGIDVASTAFHSSGGNSGRKISCFKC